MNMSSSLILLVGLLVVCAASPFSIQVAHRPDDTVHNRRNGGNGIKRLDLCRPYGRKRNAPTTCYAHIRGGADKTKGLDDVAPSPVIAPISIIHDEDSKNEFEKRRLLSKITFSYATGLMDKARMRRLETSDALHVPADAEMNNSVPRLSQIYNELRAEAMSVAAAKGKNVVQAGESPLILAKALIKHQQKMFVRTGVLRLTNTLVQAFPALLVARLLRLIEAGAPAEQSANAAIGLLTVLSLKMVTENQYFHGVVQGSTQVRGALAGLIFDKAMRLPSGGVGTVIKSKKNKDGNQGGLGVGGVINLMQSDSSIIEATALQLHTLWDGPLQITIYTALLLKFMGPSVLWGIGVLLLTIPMNATTLRVLNRLRKQENLAKDARNKRTTECISNMKILKLQGWEQSFAKSIQGERKEEMRRHLKRGSIRALNSALSNSIPTLVLVVTLVAYAKSGRPVVASKIFTAISLLNQLRFPLLFYPMLIDALANGNNSLKRISQYLTDEELTPYVQETVGGEGGSIELVNGNFLWSSKTGAAALCDADLSIKPGEVVAVIGQVGNGKTALIKALLGELQPVPRMIVDQSAMSSSNSTHISPAIMGLPSVTVGGEIAYCAQEAWLPKGSIRESIVFGREYNEDRYKAAIRDAGLEPDIIETSENIVGESLDEFLRTTSARGMLSHETDVGEGGSSLSGGQRARVALARALYDSNAKVYLLDDPLAALDATVSANVFENLTMRLRNKKAACIFVTNDPSLPRRCDKVVLMGKSETSSSPDCSTIVDIGTYDELISRGHDMRNIAAKDIYKIETGKSEVDSTNGDCRVVNDQSNHTLLQGYEEQEEEYFSSSRFVGLNDTIFLAGTTHADPDTQVVIEHEPDAEFEVTSATELIKSNVSVNGVRKECEEMVVKDRMASQSSIKLSSVDDMMATGAVPKSTYATYFKSVRKPTLIVGMLMSYMLANAAQFFQQYTVMKWTELGSGHSVASALGGKYLKSLVASAGVVSIFLWLRSYLTLRLGYRASTFLHDRLLKAILGAPMSFYDATPSGQLLSRFGKELEVVDRSLPDQIGSVLFCFMQIFFSCAALAGAVTPAMIAPLGVLGVAYVGTMSRFRNAAMDLKRCESKSRAPIYTHFSEALKGTETIRSISRGKHMWSSEHRKFTDANLSIFYSVKALDRWLSVRLESLGNLIVFSVAMASITLTRGGSLGAGSAGWGLTQALSITGLLNWAVRCLTDFETQMMSVLRITEITDLDSNGKMPRELANVGEAIPKLNGCNLMLPSTVKTDTGLIESGWPWEGRVNFRNVSMRYNPVSGLALQNVSIDVPAGSTLGIVGRTGSGKSSLLLALFRIVEMEGTGGIEIDGVDIRSMSLESLRRSLAIIPQDPVLFAGTLLFNLDATGNATKEDAWQALEKASPELAQEFRDGVGLETMITEGGKNMSVGQRQLICLARALLRKSRILVLDEATSAVDSKTDEQVQSTIRKQFVEKGVTVITVAHRLETVLGYDRIAVLGTGKVLEFGSPIALLRKRSGELRKLVDADTRKRQKGEKNTLTRSHA